MSSSIFRFTSAGAVDDGKSTVLARLLMETGQIFFDQIKNLANPNQIADLLDGLEGEREQGITIDVAHRTFEFQNRRFQVADSPGHEQYTRNMATACAGSDALVLVIDVARGLRPQSKLHLEIAMRLGLKNFLVIVNKMDLVGYRSKDYLRVSNEVQAHMAYRLNIFNDVDYLVIPASGLTGANVAKRDRKLAWFKGPTVLDALTSLNPKPAESGAPKLLVQYVQRLEGGGRRYLGRLEGGTLKVGEKVFANSNLTKIRKVWSSGTETSLAVAGSVSIELEPDSDLGVGGLISREPSEFNDQFQVDLIWLSTQLGIPGRKYLLRSGSMKSKVSLTGLSAIDLETDEKLGQIKSVQSNQIVRATIALDQRLPLQPAQKSSEFSRFVLIDPLSAETIAVGSCRFALRRSENVRAHEFAITPVSHTMITGVSGQVLWLTGLPASGKSTVANQVSQELFRRRVPHYVLDGDNLRLGINRDLGFSEADRTENIRRTAEISSLMANAGLVVLVALVSPSQSDRAMAKEIVGEARFREIYLATPIDICEKRDQKGLYEKAREGQIPNFTGISSPYEEPLNPWLRLEDSDIESRELTDWILGKI